MRRYPADKDIPDRNVAAAVGASIRALGNLTYANGGIDPSLAARQTNVFAEHFHTLELGHRPAQGPSASSHWIAAPL